MKVTKYEIETDTAVATIEKLWAAQGEDQQWIAGVRSKDRNRQQPTVFAGSAKAAGHQLAAELRKMADVIDESLRGLS